MEYLRIWTLRECNKQEKIEEPNEGIYIYLEVKKKYIIQKAPIHVVYMYEGEHRN